METRKGNWEPRHNIGFLLKSKEGDELDLLKIFHLG